MARMMTDYDPLLQQLDRESLARSARVRQLLIDGGNTAVLAEYDQAMRDIALGLSSARGCWHALSAPQRAVLVHLATYGGRLVLRAGGTGYGAQRKLLELGRVGKPTVRNLIARNLLDLDGGPIDPESSVLLSERGSFVVRRGQ